LNAVPHVHTGKVELCYDRFCARITTTQEAASLIGGVFVGALFLYGLSKLIDAISD